MSVYFLLYYLIKSHSKVDDNCGDYGTHVQLFVVMFALAVSRCVFDVFVLSSQIRGVGSTLEN